MNIIKKQPTLVSNKEQLLNSIMANKLQNSKKFIKLIKTNSDTFIEFNGKENMLIDSSVKNSSFSVFSKGAVYNKVNLFANLKISECLLKNYLLFLHKNIKSYTKNNKLYTKVRVLAQKNTRFKKKLKLAYLGMTYKAKCKKTKFNNKISYNKKKGRFNNKQLKLLHNYTLCHKL